MTEWKAHYQPANDIVCLYGRHSSSGECFVAAVKACGIDWERLREGDIAPTAAQLPLDDARKIHYALGRALNIRDEAPQDDMREIAFGLLELLIQRERK